MNIPKRCSTAIIGGGPAGSALAALLAQSGQAPVLLEKDRFPRDKLCGEFLSMEAQGLLSRIGCLNALRSCAPAVLRCARFFSPSGRKVEFGLGAQALGLSRRALDERLFRHAQERGAAAFEGVRVIKIEPAAEGAVLLWTRRRADGKVERGELRADLAIIASGRSFVATPRRPASLSVGLKRRHRFAPGADSSAGLRGCVEVHFFDGGYCGVNEVENESVNVCVLADQRWLASLPSPRWDALAVEMSRKSPSLAARLSSLRADAEPLAVARVALAAPGPVAGSLLRLGDAAGMIAPLCGDGQAMALESALLLSELMLKTPRAALASAWAAQWDRRFSPRLRLGAWISLALARPTIAEVAAAALGRWPALALPLLDGTRGRPP